VSSTDATVTCPSLALSPQDHSISATTILLPHVSLVPLFLSSPASQNPEREKPHPSTVGLPWRRRFGRFLAKPSTPAGAPLHPLPHAARNLRGSPQIAPKSSFPSRSLPLFIIDYGNPRPPPPVLSTPRLPGNVARVLDPFSSSLPSWFLFSPRCRRRSPQMSAAATLRRPPPGGAASRWFTPPSRGRDTLPRFLETSSPPAPRDVRPWSPPLSGTRAASSWHRTASVRAWTLRQRGGHVIAGPHTPASRASPMPGEKTPTPSDL
jgi:hypothetical protein